MIEIRYSGAGNQARKEVDLVTKSKHLRTSGERDWVITSYEPKLEVKVVRICLQAFESKYTISKLKGREALW